MSDEVQFPKKNPDFGSYEYSERVNPRIRRDIERKTDAMGLTIMAAGLGSFVSGTTYYQEPLVVNIPTANTLDLSGQGSVNKTVLNEIVSHFERFGDGGPKVRAIYVPTTVSKELRQWPTATTSAAGTIAKTSTSTTVGVNDIVDSATANSLWRQGAMMDPFGMGIAIIPKNVLVDNYVWVATTKPAFRMYVKPSMDEVYDSTGDYTHAKRNVQALMMDKYLKIIQPEPYAMNYLRVQYAV